MVLYDSHVHLDEECYTEDQTAVIERAFAAGIFGMINIGSDMASSAHSVALADRYPTIYAAVGVHPHEAEKMVEEDFRQLAAWTNHPKVVAIGEIGLDYFYDYSPRDVQKQAFIRQLALARDVKKPVIIHERDAHGDFMTLLRREGQGLTGIVHCYSGSLEMAKELISRGFYLGIGGSVTFKNSKKLRQIVTTVDLSHLVVETDCPYLTPVPYRGKRNEPAYVRLVAQKIAELKAVDEATVAAATMQNLHTLLKIPLNNDNN